LPNDLSDSATFEKTMILASRQKTIKSSVRVCAALTMVGVLLAANATLAEPFRPASDDQILEQLPTASDSVSRDLQKLRAALDADPNNLKLARQLAGRYISLGRAEADPRYYGYAEAALKPWIDRAAPPAEVGVLRAVLRQNRHDFDGALDELAPVLAANPRHAQALLTQAFVLQVQGKYDAARRSCRQLPRGVHPLVIATCVARIESLTGRADTGYGLLERGLAAWTNAPSQLRLWALTNLGEIAQRTGDSGAAERHYREALGLGRDAYARGAYADLLLDAGRASEVRELLADDTRIDAQLLRLAIAEARLGKSSAKDHVAALTARFAASRLRGSVIHRREEARFTLEILDHPAEALALAQANWQVQREPWDARLVLAAALAADRPGQAQPVVDWVRRTGLEDPQIEQLVERAAARFVQEES
jgi:Tfp pilus assembly protein PilF